MHTQHGLRNKRLLQVCAQTPPTRHKTAAHICETNSYCMSAHPSSAQTPPALRKGRPSMMKQELTADNGAPPPLQQAEALLEAGDLLHLHSYWGSSCSQPPHQHHNQQQTCVTPLVSLKVNQNGAQKRGLKTLTKMGAQNVCVKT